MSETAQQRLSRLMALVPWLMAHQGSTLEETASHFGVSREQLIKDLDLLIVSGKPGYLHGDLLDIQYWDDGGKITVLDPQTLDHPVALTMEEAAALLVSLQLLAQIPGIHDRETLISTAEKLAAAIDQRPTIAIDLRTGSDDIIGSCIASRSVVRIEYQTDVESFTTVRDIEPRRILLVNGVSYVEAWCRRAEAVRTFRLDRVMSAVATGESFDPSEQSDQVDFLSAARKEIIVVRMTASWVLDLLNAQQVARSEDTITISINVADDEWLARLLLMIGPDLVQAPQVALEHAERMAHEIVTGMGYT